MELDQLVNRLLVVSFTVMMIQIGQELLEHLVKRLVVPAYRNEQQKNCHECYEANSAAGTKEYQGGQISQKSVLMPWQANAYRILRRKL